VTILTVTEWFGPEIQISEGGYYWVFSTYSLKQ